MSSIKYLKIHSPIDPPSKVVGRDWKEPVRVVLGIFSSLSNSFGISSASIVVRANTALSCESVLRSASVCDGWNHGLAMAVSGRDRSLDFCGSTWKTLEALLQHLVDQGMIEEKVTARESVCHV